MSNLKIFCCRRGNCYKKHRGRSSWDKDSFPIHWRWPALDIQVIRTSDQKFRKTNYPYYTCSQIEGDPLYSWYKKGTITTSSYFEILDYTIGLNNVVTLVGILVQNYHNSHIPVQNNMKYLGPCMLVPNMYPVNIECLIGSQRPEPETVEQNKCMYRILFILWSSGKGKNRGRHRKVTQRSYIDYRLSIVDIDFPEALHSIWLPPPPTFQEVVCRVNIGHLRVTLGHCRSL